MRGRIKGPFYNTRYNWPSRPMPSKTFDTILSTSVLNNDMDIKISVGVFMPLDSISIFDRDLQLFDEDGM